MSNWPYRILMLSRFSPPDYCGAALQAISFAKNLRARGHRVTFIIRQGPELNPQDEIEGFRGTHLEAGRGEKHREFRYWWNFLRSLVRRRGDFDFSHSHGIYYTDTIMSLPGSPFGVKTLAKSSELHSVGTTARIYSELLQQTRAADKRIAQAHSDPMSLPLFRQWGTHCVLLLDGLLRDVLPSDILLAPCAHALHTAARNS